MNSIMPRVFLLESRSEPIQETDDNRGHELIRQKLYALS